MKSLLNQWCQEFSASEEEGYKKLKLNFIGTQGDDFDKHALTSTDTSVNPWYGVFTKSMEGMNLNFEPEVFPAATDSRFLRLLGVRALGFSPMRNSEILLHENDEYLEEQVFVEGIGVYVGLIEALSSQKRDIDIQAEGEFKIKKT